MDSLGTAEAVVTVSERGGAAGFSVPRNRSAAGMRWRGVSVFRRRGRLRSPTVTAARSDVPPRDDVLADRHDAIYRDNPESRVREVVA
jgi:hypothetical protein